MSLFHDILLKLSHRLTKEAGDVEAVALVISDHIGVTVPPSALTIRKGAVYVAVMPTVKMAIMTKKEAILASFKQRGFALSVIS